MNNSSRGVMKMSTEKIDGYQPITSQTEAAGLPDETLADLKGVEQLDKLDDARGLLLVRGEGGSLDLKTIALPEGLDFENTVTRMGKRVAQGHAWVWRGPAAFRG